MIRIFLLLMCTTGCVTAPIMQESYYNQVAAGSSISDVETIYGEPYEVRQLPNGLQEYSYMQRIELGSAAVEQMEFIFLVKQGIIINKECKRSGTSSFQFHQ